MKLRLTLFFFLFQISYVLLAQNYRTISAEKIYMAADRYYFEPQETIDYSIFIGGDFNREKESRKIKVTLENARGQIIDSVVLATVDLQIGGSFVLPKKGGIFYLKAIGIHQLNYLNAKPIVKEIFVQEYLTKTFFIDLQLDKNNYNSQALVNAEISYTTSGNQLIADMEAEVHLVSNGDILETKVLRTSEKGKISTTFTLPHFNKTESTNFYITTSCLYRGETFSQSKKIKTDKPKIIAQLFYEHGNTGYLVGQQNIVVVKSADEFGNDFDIIGKLIDENGTVIKNFESFVQGLGSFSFKPLSNKKYYFVTDDISILLEEAEHRAAFISSQSGNEFQLQVEQETGSNYHWIISNKSNILLDKTGNLDPFSLTITKPTILSSTLLLGETIVAQRHYLMGWDKISYASIETPYNIMMAKDFTELNISNPTEKAASYSLAIVEENNIKQIEDKSHNALTWILLGSEYARDIERPQFYFDKTNIKAEQAISLLMNTLHPASIRDIYTGNIKAFADKEYLNNYVIGGVIRENNDNNSRLVLKNGSVIIKNSNMGTTTDENGVFRLEVPASFKGNLEIIVKKGIEKQVFPINHLGFYKDFSEGFTNPQTLVKNAETLAPSVLLAETPKQNLVKTPKENNGNATILIERDKNIMSYKNQATYTSSDIAMLPTRNLNSIASVSIMASTGYWYNWNWSSISPVYPADMYLPPYKAPFSIELEHAQIGHKNLPTARSAKNSTLYWQPIAHLQQQEKVRIAEHFNPKSGGYRILVEGMDEDGDFFYGEKYIQIKEKLEVVTNIPNKLFIGDIPKIPVTITNNLNEAARVNVGITGLESQLEVVELKPFETVVKYYALDKIVELTDFIAYVSVTSSDFEFYASKSVNVGVYKIQETVNIAGNNTTSQKVNLSNAEVGSFYGKLKIYPTFDQQLIQISENMLRQPGGCFEQVSSSNYPNILVLMLMNSSNSKNQELKKRATDYLNSGYTQLANYETPSGGFEWYGRNPPHESLTAYGLLQFALIKEIGFSIDQNMFNRNLEWLWKQRDKKGGFHFHPGKYGFASAPYEVNNAYITWVLSRVSSYNLDEQIEAIESDLNQKFDAYKMALLVNTLFNNNKNSLAEKYLEKLKSHLLVKNFVGLTAEKSVVNAHGRALDTEVIALTLLATLNTQDDVFKQQLKSAVFTTMNNRGYFGSTQATALSLEALTRLGLTEHRLLNHSYTVKLNGRMIDEIDYDDRNAFELDIINLDQTNYGINEFSVETNGVSVPFVLELKWIESRTSSLHPDLNFMVKFKKDSLEVGENNLLKIKVENTTQIGKGQVVATINIPETYQISTEELRDLSRKKVVDYYELKGNELNLYFLELGPREIKEIALNLTAAYPGTYHTATHEVFEYYNPEIVSKIVSPTAIITEKY